MRLLLTNHLRNALDSLRSNRLRTGLTVLGVTIGIASIVVILSLSAGATHLITSQLTQAGGAVAVLRTGSATKDTQINNLTSTIAGSQATSSLTEQDVTSLQAVKNVPA